MLLYLVRQSSKICVVRRAAIRLCLPCQSAGAAWLPWQRFGFYVRVRFGETSRGCTAFSMHFRSPLWELRLLLRTVQRRQRVKTFQGTAGEHCRYVHPSFKGLLVGSNDVRNQNTREHPRRVKDTTSRKKDPVAETQRRCPRPLRVTACF